MLRAKLEQRRTINGLKTDNVIIYMFLIETHPWVLEVHPCRLVQARLGHPEGTKKEALSITKKITMKAQRRGHDTLKITRQSTGEKYII